MLLPTSNVLPQVHVRFSFALVCSLPRMPLLQVRAADIERLVEASPDPAGLTSHAGATTAQQGQYGLRNQHIRMHLPVLACSASTRITTVAYVTIQLMMMAGTRVYKIQQLMHESCTRFW